MNQKISFFCTSKLSENNLEFIFLFFDASLPSHTYTQTEKINTYSVTRFGEISALGQFF